MNAFILGLFILCLPIGYASAWTLEHNEDGLKIYTQEIKDSSFKAFRGETTVKSTLKNLVAHHIDIEQMKNWLHPWLS